MSIPRVCAKSSLRRIAAKQRPIQERNTKEHAATVKIRAPKLKKYQPNTPSILIRPVTGTQTNGLSSTISPRVPFVTLFQLRMTSRASSENASVTTAKKNAPRLNFKQKLPMISEIRIVKKKAGENPPHKNTRKKKASRGGK